MFNSIKMIIFFTLLTGFIYPLFVTGFAQLFFPLQANGSLILQDKNIIGSELIAQKFTQNIYFWPRPSASDYGAMPSGATNLSATSKALSDKINEQKKLYSTATIPSELLTSSASGLDPHLSPQAAFYQENRVASARNLSDEQKMELHQMIEKMTIERTGNFLGMKRVNVLELNLELDKRFK